MTEDVRRPGTGAKVPAGSGKGGTTAISQPGADSSTLEGAPGQVIYGDGPVTINACRPVTTVSAGDHRVGVNTADRPITVGSHYHFAETNPAL